jgi:quercetin dioxygenase-like cupin family protein
MERERAGESIMAVPALGAVPATTLGACHLTLEGIEMKRALLATSGSLIVFAAITLTVAWAGQRNNKIFGLTPQQVRWFTPSYYKDGRQRAQLLGDSSQGGAWVDRVKIPAGKRVLAHTHPHDEVVTIIEGIWYLGEGKRFETTKLKGYPAGSFIVIPAGLPHYVAAEEGPVIVQLSGTGKFNTEYLEK